MKNTLIAILLAVTGLTAYASVLPKPTEHFTDTTQTIQPDVANTFNHNLADYERQTSNQFLVYMTDSVPDGEDYQQLSIDSFHDWKVGLAGKDNGVVLFIYLKSHKMFLATGRGLEGAIPDATAHQIIADVIKPRFKANDYSGGINAAIVAVEKAASGEYKGTGQTVAETLSGLPANWELNCIEIVIGVALIIFILIALSVPEETPDESDNLYTPPSKRSQPESGGGFFSGLATGALLDELTEPEHRPSRSSDDSSSSSSSSSSFDFGSSSSSDSSSSNDSFSSGGGDSGGGGSGGDW